MDREDFLLSCDVKIFNEEIERMEIGDIVHMIQVLQTEMTCEQEYFNELSADLATIDDATSQDGQALSVKMIESQTRLTDLVSRNMKCFMLQTTSQGEGDLAGMIEVEEDKSPGPEAEAEECNGAVLQDDETEFVKRWHGSHKWRPEGDGVGTLTDISEEAHTDLDRHSRDEHHTSSSVSFPWQPTSIRAHRDEELHSGRFVFRASHEVDDVGRLNANIEEYESVMQSDSVALREPTHNAPDWNNAELAHSTQSDTCVFDSRNVTSQNHVTNSVVMNHLGPEMRSDSSAEEYHQMAITNRYHSNHKDGGEVDDADRRVSFTDLRSRFETEKSCDRVVKRSFSATKLNHTHSTVGTSSLKLQNNNESGRENGECIEPVTDSESDSKTRYVTQNSVDNSDTFEGEPAMNVVGRVNECSVKDTNHVTLYSPSASLSHTAEGDRGATELRHGVDSPHTSESVEMDSHTGVSVHSCTYGTGVSVDSHIDNTCMSVDSRTDNIGMSVDSHTDGTGVSVDSHTDDACVRVEHDIKVSTAKVVLSVLSVSEVDDDTDHKLPVESVSSATSHDASEETRDREVPSELPPSEGEGVYEKDGSIQGDELENNVLIMGQETKKAPPPPTSEDHLTNNNVKRHVPAVPTTTPVPVEPVTPVEHKELPPTVEPSTDVLSNDIVTDDDKVKARVTLKNWEPKKLLEELYGIHLMEDMTARSTFINMEGYLEKLPLNKKKATLLKTWKRRYFKALNGILYYFETNALGEKANSYFQLMGGKVEDLGNRILGVDDGRGRYLLVRCPTAKEFGNWKKSLESQMSGNIGISYVKPVLAAPPHKKQIIVIDIGSCSVRAGVLRQQPSLPDVFFPTVAAVHKETGAETFGFEALSAKARTEGNLVFPVRPSVRIDQASLIIHLMPGLIRKVFADLKVDPTQHWVMMSMPANLSDKMKEQLMDIFVKEFQVKGVNMVNQSVLALYSYNTRSGIIVDIGERLEIIPVTDGYIVEGGVTRQPYGGHRVCDALNSCLTQCKYTFFSEVEFYLVRLAMEKLCFVTNDYQETMRKYHINNAQFSDSVDLATYDLPEGLWTNIRTDIGRFQCPEGLFDLELWGMDNDSVQKLVQKAVQACPMDTRREMWRSIYLSGGTTQIPGFIDRLQLELNKSVPSTIVVEVHASPHRYHAAYIGACTLASLDVFQQSCISATQWQREGPASLRKWHMY